MKTIGPPICVEASGTWTGTSGELYAYKGTFVLRNDGTLILL